MACSSASANPRLGAKLASQPRAEGRVPAQRLGAPLLEQEEAQEVSLHIAVERLELRQASQVLGRVAMPGAGERHPRECPEAVGRHRAQPVALGHHPFCIGLVFEQVAAIQRDRQLEQPSREIDLALVRGAEAVADRLHERVGAAEHLATRCRRLLGSRAPAHLDRRRVCAHDVALLVDDDQPVRKTLIDRGGDRHTPPGSVTD